MYIDAEKLKERISRLRDEFIKKSETKGYTALEYRHKAEGLHLALQLIDSLQQEQPSTSPDFDTAVHNWLRKHGSDETRQLIEMTARHFWEMAQVGGAMLHIADKSYKMGRRDERFEMMKGAVEAYVNISANIPGGSYVELAVDIPASRLKKKDKVKIIIIK